jgi:iron(III) transport system substrate-binding protein
MAIGVWLIACGADSEDQDRVERRQEVVIYTALDQLYSEPILKRFEEQTGIRVRAVYDSEAAKTVGLANRIIAERERPRCDVFWNNEVLRTLVLKDKGLLEAFSPANARQIPAAFRDPEGYWTGFAARARVLAYNTRRVAPEDLPRTLSDLTNERWRGRVGMAYPLFGSTSTHAAVLWARWGEPRARRFFEDLKRNDVAILDGNMTAARAVADGELDLCLTDTDDAHLLRSEGKPIDWVLLDHDGEGALLFPNALSLIKNGPNPEAGRRLIEYLLSPEVEAALAASQSAQIPLRPNADAPPKVQEMARGSFLEVDFAEAAAHIEESADFLKTLFSKP